MNDYQGLQLAKQRHREFIQEVENARLVKFASEESQRRSDRTAAGTITPDKRDGIRQIVPVTVLSTR